MTSPEGFGALILTHGRPDKQWTIEQLRRRNYTGPLWLVIDDEDPTGDEYRRRYGEAVLTFSKAEEARRTDAADPSTNWNVVVYARNASQRLARELGLRWFVQLDDDYWNFKYRLRDDGPGAHYGLRSTEIHDLDGVFAAMIGLLEDTGALTVAMSQGGDHIGGGLSQTGRLGFKRKAMNSFVLRTDRPVEFMGRLNEDVNAYCVWGSRGEIFLSLTHLQLEQRTTQKQAGGLTDAYLDSGTYVKSFYTVMMCPSFVDIRTMGRTDRRLHHRVDWGHAVPKILPPGLRKAEAGV